MNEGFDKMEGEEIEMTRLESQAVLDSIEPLNYENNLINNIKNNSVAEADRSLFPTEANLTQMEQSMDTNLMISNDIVFNQKLPKHSSHHSSDNFMISENITLSR